MKYEIAAVCLAAALPIFAISCAGLPKQTRPAYKLTDYYPMKKGYVWSYKITTFENNLEGASSVSTTKITNENGGEFTLSQGDASFKYKVDASGYSKMKSGSYILKKPIEKGRSWNIETNGMKGTAKILDNDADVAVLENKFEDCVVVEESYPKIALLVSTYCPNVGLVKLEEYAILDGREILGNRVELLGFSKGEEVP